MAGLRRKKETKFAFSDRNQAKKAKETSKNGLKHIFLVLYHVSLMDVSILCCILTYTSPPQITTICHIRSAPK